MTGAGWRSRNVTVHSNPGLAARHSALPSPRPGRLPSAGPGEAECHDALAASAAEARQLEAAIAAAQAEAEELGAAIAAEREEAEALRAQLGDLEGQNAAAGERVESNARFLSTAQWCVLGRGAVHV